VVVGIAAGMLLGAAASAVPVLTWTFAQHRGVPIRTRVTARLRWLARRKRVWSMPIRARSGVPPCLRGVRLLLATDTTARHQPVAGVVQAPGGAYTVVFPVATASLAFLAADEQSSRFAGWGAVLGSLCVSDDTTVGADRVAWVDIHRGGNPDALVAFHRDAGVPGPASVGYGAWISGQDAAGSAHRVLVAVTLSRARQLQPARRNGFGGSIVDTMMAATIHVADELAGQLTAAGYVCDPLLTPADLGRVLVEAGDPFATRHDERTTRERFAMAERCGPQQVTVHRHHVSIDGAEHRVFALAWPKIAVAGDWLWKPLGGDGPKIVTTVFEPIPAFRANATRDALTTRAASNNVIAALSGRVRSIDRRKADALAAAERKVSDGHQELDGYCLVDIAAPNADELARRCQLLRQTLYEAGRAGVRELTGVHDFGWAAALPLGIYVAPAAE
jgi:hypothetical protein